MAKGRVATLKYQRSDLGDGRKRIRNSFIQRGCGAEDGVELK